MNKDREDAPDRSRRRQFQTTRWSLVTCAVKGSDQALSELCEAYWPPLYGHLRRLGYSYSNAQDLTQAFFVRLLEKGILDFADHRRGRFRTFLLTALRRFIVNEWKRDGAIKRGGDHTLVAMDHLDDADSFLGLTASDLTPEQSYDRQWAINVLQRAFGELEAENRRAGRAELFAAVAPCLTEDRCVPSYQALAARFDTTPEALKMRVSRLRRRLGELIREEIRKTVADERDVEDELEALIEALRP